MLVLSRRVGEAIQIGDNVEVMVVRIGPEVVRIGIVAPKEMSIYRQEMEFKVGADAKDDSPREDHEPDCIRSR